MFVILLTAQNSGPVILDRLIASRAKVCLCFLTRGECKYSAELSKLRQGEERLTYARSCPNYHLCDTQQEVVLLYLATTPASFNYEFRSGNNLLWWLVSCQSGQDDLKQHSDSQPTCTRIIWMEAGVHFQYWSHKNEYLVFFFGCFIAIPVSAVSCIVSTSLTPALLHNIQIKEFKRGTFNIRGEENSLL